MTTNLHNNFNTAASTLYISFELSAATWKLGFSDQLGRRPRIRSISAGNFEKLVSEIDAAKAKFGLAEDAPVISCYEAGRDGFWIHRCLTSMEIENHIVDPASIQVNRRKRRAKTDRIDAEMIVSALIRYKAGDKYACRMIRIPDAEAEDARQLNREMVVIKKERSAHSNRIKGLLVTQGINVVTISRDFVSLIETIKTGDGNLLKPGLRQRLIREFERMVLATEQIRSLQMEQAEMIRKAAREVCKTEATEATESQGASSASAVIAERLSQLCGIGPVTAFTLATEIFSWRDIRNRKQLAALVGLVPTPQSSGSEEREQGISKSGRGELRVLMVEIGWGWLKHQPDSALTQWYNNRFADGTKRNRKIGIVALARKLLVALGKYVRDGEIPEGAKFKEVRKFAYMTSLKPKQTGKGGPPCKNTVVA